jgi:serine phosphatase RsbU (regulator of sigma subunit)
MAGPQIVPGAAFGASLIVINPSGNRIRVPLDPLPFHIGRQADNHLVLRDNRASRSHARIVVENGEYYIEDLKSSHGVWVNGVRVSRHKLANSDSVEFGITDSYRLIFTVEEAEIERLLGQLQPSTGAAAPGARNLSRIRALVEVARALQTSLSLEDVLSAVVDAALAITGSERGFLLLKTGDDLEVSVARTNQGAPLGKTDLQVPTRLIHRALGQRRELLSMNFDPEGIGDQSADRSVADLELRSVVCVPLVQVRAGSTEKTSMSSTMSQTVGMLYLDSRKGAADLSAGNRELLQTLALEASTILENARLLEEERKKQRMEEELAIAREIQQGLLPRSLPRWGWFRAAGSSLASHQVGGDYFDVRQLNDTCWGTVVADVSGKGVSSALLASLLQGAFLLASEGPLQIEEMLARINRFLNERTQGEKYATIFYCTVSQDGIVRWTNAGHCAPIILRGSGVIKSLRANALPVGLLEETPFPVEDAQLEPGDKVIIYSDGLTEAMNPDGKFFDAGRVRELCRLHNASSCEDLHKSIIEAVQLFTEGAPQRDDITLVVLEYRP